ncbi:MAG TPA: ATP-binding protein [Coxiellaceae bacterium]|nr:ATP-binding protein [Coxiellaceae bacterium]
MTPSIRTFLLINLLLSVTLITSLAIIGNLFLAHKDIQTQLDTQLIRTTLQMQALFSDGIEIRKLPIVQASLQEAIDPVGFLKKHNPSLKLSKRLHNALTSFHQETTFQIWNDQKQLILHSRAAPHQPLSSGHSGLSNLWLNGETWRVYTDHDPNNHLTFMVGEQSNFRQKLENELTRDSIFIMLVTYPFLGVLIWIIVGRGLDTLKKVASEVSHRAPSYLKPVDIKAVPLEIMPLVNELNSLFTRLDEAFEREKRFTADAAHELKTPLAALKTQVQVALKIKTEPERQETLKKVLASVDRSTHVVQQLLTLSRMLPQSEINDPREVNLATLGAQVAADLVPNAFDKEIELELIESEKPAIVWGNVTSLGILLRNLIDNAIRYTPPHGHIHIKLETPGDHVIIKIQDTGPGIPTELRKRVFERFFRVIGNKAPGSGLGLGIVQQIARLHQAHIELDTPEWGHGLEVRVIFPPLPGTES